MGLNSFFTIQMKGEEGTDGADLSGKSNGFHPCSNARHKLGA